MDTQTQEPRNYGFVVGLVTGAFVGAGLALWLAPRGASELGERLTDSARSLGERSIRTTSRGQRPRRRGGRRAHPHGPGGSGRGGRGSGARRARSRTLRHGLLNSIAQLGQEQARFAKLDVWTLQNRTHRQPTVRRGCLAQPVASPSRRRWRRRARSSPDGAR